MADFTLALTVMKEHGEFVAWSSASVLSTGAGLVAAVQTLFDPANAWVPAGVLITLVLVSIGTTAKVVRLLDGIKAGFEKARKERKKLAKALNIDIDGDDD